MRLYRRSSNVLYAGVLAAGRHAGAAEDRRDRRGSIGHQ